MQDYRIVIPLGAQLPQVGQVLTTHEKDFADRPITIKVAAINGITWGTAPDKEDGGKHKVAAIFVDLYGAPYPEIVTPGTIFPKKKHFVIFDRRTAEPKACYDLGDAIREMSPNKCPVCERKKQDSDTFEAVGTSIRLLAETMAAYGISMEGCTTWEELLARILEKVPKKRTRKKAEGKAVKNETTTENS